MSTATMTSKGQITVPKEVRVLLGLHTGTKVKFNVSDSGEVRFSLVTDSITNLKGIIARPRKSISIEDMANTIKARGSRL
jgi:AbrB family looped-hinge helix DNA binding protein